MTSAGAEEPLRIAIVTSGRYHVLDLARELRVLGHDVTLYSLLPPTHVSRRGLDPGRAVWLGWGAGLAYAANRLRSRLGLRFPTDDLVRSAVGHTAAFRLRPCDVLIGMSGMSLPAIRAARCRFGAITFLERSSQHIVAQAELLGLDPDLPVAERELQEYALVDRISVPSRHVLMSFVERGFSAGKMTVNPLGVDLREFPWGLGPQGTSPLRVLFAGNWSRQKGADLLEEVANELAHLDVTHVGPADSRPIRSSSRIRSFRPVPQGDLAAWYHQADVLVLPSRQDGFGMVLTQALAAGCHVIASDRTGGPDLLELLGPDAPISIVPAGSARALRETLAGLDVHRRTLRQRRREVPAWRSRLSWTEYAARYVERIHAARKGHQGPSSMLVDGERPS